MEDKKLEDAVNEAETDQSFNEDELQDIMNEIESLEKEFVDEGDVAQAPVMEAAPEEAPSEVVSEDKSSLEAELEAEIERTEVNPEPVMESEPEMVEPAPVEPVMESEPVAMEEQPAPMMEAPSNVVELSEVSGAPGDMSFSGSGKMNMSFNFPVGEHMAKITIDGSGLKVEMPGAHLEIDESTGCTIHMDGGINFNVPLSNGNSVKKAS